MLSYLIVFLIMVVLLSLFAFGAKRFARGRLTLGNNGGTGRSRQPRLGIVDIYELDRQRQLILLRRDNTEHLLLVGGPNDVVVERNIVRAGTARVTAELADRTEPEGPDAPLPLPAGTEPAPLPPPFPEPELTRAPEPERVAAAFAPTPRRESPAREMSARETSGQETSGSEMPAPQPPPEPARPASRFNASRRVEPPSLRAARQTPPPLETPLPEVPPFAAPVPPVMPVPPSMPEAVRPPEPVPAPAGTRGTEPRNVDAAILNDMARQLEEALRRPSSAVAPARPAASVASPPAVQVPPEPAPPPPPPPEPEPEPEPAPPPPPEPPPPPPEPEPAPPPPPEPEPVPEPPPAPPPPPPEQPAPASKPASVQNPFSVEEIEAEFARLLGRPLDKR
ncbi:hypothetical protein DA075_15465 [Methylobacterium currus]|uniref:Flagellar biosynthesis protein FliO n=1 Tax=Methylobacterium currus TaxID=2051553 RepID=A0A2R4WTM3_9HYPH|nr:hypothetical protein [Methylobacterium currus]AWB24900.1 hypothetical protein DA075_15465 [Methylobacterium currus]UHC18222.1 hypothetical protein LRS73_10465 [Methylobacterium currus]